MFNEMWNVKLCLNLWETNKVHVRFHSVHLGNWPFFISCNYLGNKTQCKNHNVGVFVHVFSLSVSFFFFKFLFFSFLLKYIPVYFFFLFSSFWNFQHIRDAKVIAWKQFSRLNLEVKDYITHQDWALGPAQSTLRRIFWGDASTFLAKVLCVVGTTRCYMLDRYQHKSEDTKMTLILQWV